MLYRCVIYIITLCNGCYATILRGKMDSFNGTYVLAPSHSSDVALLSCSAMLKVFTSPPVGEARSKLVE